MRTLGKFILAILAAAIGGLLVVVFQEPLIERLDRNSLLVEISGGPWSPRPPAQGDIASAWERQGLLPFQVQQILEGEPLAMARMEVRNLGSTTVSQIRLTTGRFPPDHFLILQSDQDPTRLEDAREVLLEPLDPGERAILYVWSIHDLQSRFLFDDWEVFSSDGRASVQLGVLERVAVGDATIKNIFKWVGDAAVALLILGMFLMLVVIAVHSEYVRQVLGDEVRYREEQQRFRANPAKFSIELKS